MATLIISAPYGQKNTVYISPPFFKRFDLFAECLLATIDNPLLLYTIYSVALSLVKICFVGKTAATRKEKKKLFI